MAKAVQVQVLFAALKRLLIFQQSFFFTRGIFLMIAVFVNCGAVIAGSVIGLFFARRITEEMSSHIQTAAGIVTMILGIQMAMQYHNIVYMTLSLIAGGIIGCLCDIDGKILKLGNFLQCLCFHGKETPFSEGDGNSRNFAYAFLNASVLFCVGAMSIVGSFKAGVEKDYSIIFTKSILDGFMAISFAGAMGIGTAFSAIIVFLYQGALTLLSVVIQPYVSQVLIEELTAAGGAMIVMIGINLLNLKKIKTANFLPAFILEILFVVLIK